MKTTRVGSFNRLESLIVLAIVAIHLVMSAVYLPNIWELVRTGAVSLVAALVWIVGLVALNVAALRSFLGRKLGYRLLPLSAFALAYAAFRFGWPNFLSLIAAIGAILAVLVLVLAQPWFKGQD